MFLHKLTVSRNDTSVKFNSEINLLTGATNQKKANQSNCSGRNINVCSKQYTISDSCKAVLIQFITRQRNIYWFHFAKQAVNKNNS